MHRCSRKERSRWVSLSPDGEGAQDSFCSRGTGDSHPNPLALGKAAAEAPLNTASAESSRTPPIWCCQVPGSKGYTVTVALGQSVSLPLGRHLWEGRGATKVGRAGGVKG